MNLLAISINHHTAPIEIRESVHLSSDEIKNYLRKLKGNVVDEGFIISTCNRTEIYGIPTTPNINYRDFEEFLIKEKSKNEISDIHFQKFFSCSAINHLFKVASGIDSQLIGDNQIFGQMKESFQIAEEVNTTGFLTKRIFDAAIRVGKRVKTETEISDGAITVSYAAVQLVEKIFSNLNKKSALVIGTGETGEIAAKHLRDKNIGKLVLTNRTNEKAEKLSELLGGSAIPFENFKEHLHEFDIIISATSSDNILINNDEIKSAMKKRHHAMLVLMDIALPRDISPEAKNIDNVFYHDIDSLNIIVEQNKKKRSEEIPKVQTIIMEELLEFFNWYNSLQVAPTIKSLRDFYDSIRLEEIEKNKFKINADDFEKLDIITKKIINKLLHYPTVEIKKAAGNGLNTNESSSKIGMIREIFGLDSIKEENKN